MLGLPKKQRPPNRIDELYCNKEMILNHLPKAKTDKNKKKLLVWLDLMDRIIKNEFDKAS